MGREEASSQATKGCGVGRPPATSTQGKAGGGDAVCNTQGDGSSSNFPIY